MRNVAHETGIYLAGVSAGRIAMLLPSRMAGRTLDLRGPDLARGPEVARRWTLDRLVTTQPRVNAFG